jgi:hypothetical protein
MSDTTSPSITPTPKKNGRPRKADPPRIAHHELDRLLVFGEVIDEGDGHGPATHFPSYRDLAKRYGVSHSVIANYSSRHDCLRRREAAKQRVDARTDEKLVEQRATELASGKTRALEAIDAFITAFGQALADGRVRVDSVTDFNLMIRLREFLQGGPDSRHEINATLSLTELQRRYAEMLRRLAEVDEAPEVAGMMSAGEHLDSEDRDQKVPEKPPSRAFDEAARKPNGQFGAGGVDQGVDEVPPGEDDEEDMAASG